MAQPDCCCRLTQAEINGIVASGCVWRPPSLHEIILIPNVSISISCSSHVSFERSGSTWTKFQTQCNLWKRKKAPVSCKLSDASRRNSLFCLCLIPKLSKSMAQPDCCCRLKQAEKNGIVASGCVWRPPSLHEIILCSYDVRLPLFSSHVSFERSGSTWTKFQTQCNLWKRKKAPVSCKLSDASRINNLFCLCLIPKLSKSMAQPDCCCRLKQAEINGIVASGCVWWPPSLHEIILIPYDVHLLFLLFTCFVWKIWFYLNQFPNSVQPMKTEKNTRLIQVICRIENKQPFLSLCDPQALEINGATGLLLQVHTGWDKWHCG